MITTALTSADDPTARPASSATTTREENVLAAAKRDLQFLKARLADASPSAVR